MARSTESTRNALYWVYGCSIWFLAIGPVILFALLAVFVGGSAAAPVGALAGLVVGVMSFRYGQKVLREARRYEAARARRDLGPGPNR